MEDFSREIEGRRHLRLRATGLSKVGVLAGEITNLACLGLGWVTDRNFAALVRIQVSAGTSTVAISGHWLLMDVVHCDVVSMIMCNITWKGLTEWAALSRKTRNGDTENGSLAIGVGDGVDGATDCGACFLREFGNVRSASGTVANLWCLRKSRGLGADCCHSSDEGSDGDTHCDKGEATVGLVRKDGDSTIEVVGSE